jgi:TetR/AcrR family transcriptional regulator, regulator of cefoperazone and chloramphenicol sensitivity
LTGIKRRAPVASYAGHSQHAGLTDKHLFNTLVYMTALAYDRNQPDTDGARERLLDAASQLFAISGYEVTTVRDIVNAAGTNLNAVNYYFGGKRGLYQAVMTREIERARSFTSGLARAALDDPISVRLESLVLRLLTFFVSSHSRLPRLAALEVVNPSPAFGKTGPPIYEAEREELRGIVISALGRDAPAEAIDHCVRSVLSQCMYFMFMGESLQRSASPVFSSAAAVRKLASDITSFSLGGMLPPSGNPSHFGVQK